MAVAIINERSYLWSIERVLVKNGSIPGCFQLFFSAC